MPAEGDPLGLDVEYGVFYCCAADGDCGRGAGELCYPCGGLECVVPDIGRRGTFCQESIAESKNIFKDTQPMRL